jgi:chemotaxis methyl-accepting protein methylase
MAMTLQGATAPCGVIPVTTRFFRNMPLMSEVFALIEAARLPQTRLFFHACSSGEEPYSFVMHNLNGPMMSIDVAAADYDPLVVAMAQRGRYPRHVVNESNSGFIPIIHSKYFETHFLHNMLAASVRRAVDKWLVLDYTADNIDWVTHEVSDIVFCNSSLLYHPHDVQAVVLDRLCRQSKHALVITGADNTALETVLPRHGFTPHKRNWQAIYDGCPLRRISAERPYTTPTTPWLTDRDRATEQFFRYSIFLRAGSALALAANHQLDPCVP